MRNIDVESILSRMGRTRAILCDVDGTLVDSNEFHIIAWDEAFRTLGYSIPRHLLRQQIGKGGDKLVSFLIPKSHEAEQAAIRGMHGDIFQSRFLNLVRPFPYAAEFVRSLNAQGKKVLLVSSSPQKEVEHYAEQLSITSALNATVSIDDVKESKPAPDLFRIAIEKAQIDADEALAIGDTPFDIAAAACCGVATIVVRTGGFSDQALEAADPYQVEDDIGALYRISQLT